METSLQPKAVESVMQSSHSEAGAAVSNSLASQLPTAAVASQDSTVPTDIDARYKQGLISKDEAIAEPYNNQFKQPRSFYGKIIDQYGQPVVGVQVTGSIEVLNGLGNELQTQTYNTQSDSEGLFAFTGKTGAPINVVVKKEGYIMGGRGDVYHGPPGEKTTPDDRAVLTMWKLHVPEPLLSYNIDSQVPYDGTPITFDIATGKQTSDGELRVTLTRSPLDVRRGRDIFDWTIRTEIIGGGLITENDPYPYWARENGYVPLFEFSMGSNNIPWHSTITQNFYIKTARGQYGRMQASVYSALTPARIQFGFTINPSGSQNLEPATEKQTP